MDLRLELRRTSKLVVPSPKGDLGFRWFPFPALPCRALDSSVPPGLVCGKDLWSGWLWRPLKGTWFPLVSFPGTPVPGSGFFRPFRDWFAERFVVGLVVASTKGR
jgi:hypothetical protein